MTIVKRQPITTFFCPAKALGGQEKRRNGDKIHHITAVEGPAADGIVVVFDAKSLYDIVGFSKENRQPTEKAESEIDKQRKVANTKATIWLLVRELAKTPMETNAPAKNKSPIYEPSVPPESIFPTGAPN